MDDTFDKIYHKNGNFIGGIDETGVSDIAGPIVSSCIILPKIDRSKDDLKIFEINDSKKIIEKYRKKYAEIVYQTAVAIGIGQATPTEIDYLGRLSSTKLAMKRAVLACQKVNTHKSLRPDFLLIDGEIKLDTRIPQLSIVKGDNKSLSIACASIIAKVFRDEIMLDLDKRYPYYDWKSNKGYPCENQFKGIDKHGVLPGIHRIKYWPFMTNDRFKETGKARWAKRRRRWKKTTEQILMKKMEDMIWISE